MPGHHDKPSVKRRGFASMPKERQREIASRGGRAAHAKGTAHKWTPAEARAAVRIIHAKGTAHKFTSEEAREAGRKGAQARAANRAKLLAATSKLAESTPPHACAEPGVSPSPQHARPRAAGAFKTDAHGTDVSCA